MTALDLSSVSAGMTEATEVMAKASAEILRLRAENERLTKLLNGDVWEALNGAREHIDGEIDVNDGDYGEPRPNAAMQLASLIDAALSQIDGVLK
jgi:hypothetical protein